MTLSARLAIAMVSLVILTAAGVGTISYRNTTSAALALAVRRLQFEAGMLGGELAGYVRDSTREIIALGRLPVVAEALTESPPRPTPMDVSATEASRQVADLFLAIAMANPSYLQLRLIGAANDGREIVRVDRQGQRAGPHLVPLASLRPTSHRPYYQETLRQPLHATYVSRIDLDREHGQIEVPPVPTLRIATAVRSESGDALGLVIVNLDMRRAFERLRAGAMPGGGLYLVDEAGNYLIHPDESHVFGFEHEVPHRIADEWPDLGVLTETAEPVSISITTPEDTRVAAAVWPLLLAGSLRLTLICVVPESALLADTYEITRSSLIVGFAGVMIATIVAIGVGWSLGRPLRTIGTAVRDAQAGRPVRLPQTTGGEIGELVQAFSHYLKREALLGAVFNASFDAIYTNDIGGAITSWNPSAEHLYRYSADEAVGASACMMVPPDRRSEFKDLLALAAKGEQIREIETVRVDGAGHAHDVSLTMSPIRDPSGEVVGMSTIARDISERVANQERLRQLQAELAHASRVSTAGQMAAVLAHELSQPLTAIINYVKAAQRKLERNRSELDSAVVDYMDKASEQSQRAGVIVRQLRDFIGNRTPGHTKPQDINEVVEDGIETVLIGARHQRFHLERRYASGLPLVEMDRVQVQQVVVNLVTNAIESMESTPSPLLTVATGLSADSVEVRVCDNGPGLSADEKARLFEPFSTSKRAGMGIGLTISISIVDSHGGTMAVDSEDGDGAVFRFTIPVAAERS